MFSQLIDTLGDVMHRGGWVMYPLILLSIIALTLIFERCWFWIATNRPGKRRRYHQVAVCLRAGKTDQALQLAGDDRSVYGQLVRAMVESRASEAVVRELVEIERPRIERFMPTLGTIITAAPMLGILGTVTGIIDSFRVLSEADMVTDPTAIGGGIAEALLTTVAGLVVALVVLFPYNAFRAQIDRTLGLAEALVAAARKED
jgi:biopolymer transport protein ExbB